VFQEVSVKNSRVLVLVASVVLAFAAACGKKEEPAPTASEPAAGAGAASPFDPATGNATVNGSVKLEGAAPTPAVIKMNADPNCIALHKDPVHTQEVVSEGGNLQNVFVYVKEGLEKYTFTPPTTDAEINQKGCQYFPHVGGIMVNQKLKIVNSDPTLHNIHCWAEKNPQFNIGQPVKDMSTEKTFTAPEVMVPFRCDVHKWMSTYLGVLPHPYFSVSGTDGAYSLKNLPPGDYVIEAWHEKLGTKTQKITVGDKETKEVSFSFSAS